MKTPALIPLSPTAILLALALVPGCIQAPINSINDRSWPQWRGPGGLGLSNATGLPIDWSGAILWKTPVEGLGHSSPIIWQDQIFLTTAIRGAVIAGHEPITHSFGGELFVHPQMVDANREFTFKILSFDATFGQLLWERVVYVGPVFDGQHYSGGFAAPSITTDGTLIFAWFGPEGLYAYDLNGNPAWATNVGHMASLGLGVGTSPVLFEDLVILLCDENEGERSFIVAFDKSTGAEAWKVSRTVQAGWSTPIVIDGPRGPELITNGSQLVISYDPRTGAELWRLAGLIDTWVVHTPMIGHGLAFFSAGYPRKLTKAIDLGWEKGSAQPPTLAWEYNKGTGYVPSNLVYGDYVYLMSDSGILTCLEARTGKVVYEGGRVPLPGSFRASPIAYDDKILQINEDGEAFIVKAGPAHKILGSNSLGEPVSASPAIAHGRLYIRGHEHLFAIGPTDS